VQPVIGAGLWLEVRIRLEPRNIRCLVEDQTESLRLQYRIAPLATK
jgi:hypothetical protein